MEQTDILVKPPGRIGIVGVGAFGRFCIRAYEQTGFLQVVAAADPDPRARGAMEGTRVTCSSDWRDIISNDEIEVVHVATPPFVRLDIVLTALKAGKSVFVEKPLALTLEEADEILNAEATSTACLGIDYVMRHLPAYKLLEKISTSGIAGRIRSFSFQNFAQEVPHDHWFWQQDKSGGILVEHGVHFFDVFSQLAGAPVNVWGTAPSPEAIEVSVQYENGVLGRFYHEFAFPQVAELTTAAIMFERGHVLIEGWIPTRLSAAFIANGDEVRRIVGPSTQIQKRDGATHVVQSFSDREKDYGSAVVAGMCDVINRHRDPGHRIAVSMADARSSLDLAIAAQSSCDSQNIHRFAPVI
ncbi:MAG: hypothetical protein NVSMB52_12060 [Chloroflexota bacterium]